MQIGTDRLYDRFLLDHDVCTDGDAVAASAGQRPVRQGACQGEFHSLVMPGLGTACTAA